MSINSISTLVFRAHKHKQIDDCLGSSHQREFQREIPMAGVDGAELKIMKTSRWVNLFPKTRIGGNNVVGRNSN